MRGEEERKEEGNLKEEKEGKKKRRTPSGHEANLWIIQHDFSMKTTTEGVKTF